MLTLWLSETRHSESPLTHWQTAGREFQWMNSSQSRGISAKIYLETFENILNIRIRRRRLSLEEKPPSNETLDPYDFESLMEMERLIIWTVLVGWIRIINLSVMVTIFDSSTSFVWIILCHKIFLRTKENFEPQVDCLFVIWGTKLYIWQIW